MVPDRLLDARLIDESVVVVFDASDLPDRLCCGVEKLFGTGSCLIDSLDGLMPRIGWIKLIKPIEDLDELLGGISQTFKSHNKSVNITLNTSKTFVEILRGDITQGVSFVR